MSPPEPALPQKPRPTSWIDRLTVALLAASLGVALGAAAPAFLRAAGVLPASVAAPASAAPLVLPHRPPEILAHDDPAQPFDPDDDEGRMEEPRGQLGLTRSPLVLHEQPAGAARGVGDVEAGELVTILRIAGDWALVYYGGAGGLVVGWAKKSEIAIR